MSNLSNTATISSNPTLKIGAQGSKVKELQKLLNGELGHRQQISEDGVFGTETEKVVKVIQYRFFLAQNGIVGSNTWQVLQTHALVEKPTLSKGSTGQLVARVQQVLKDGKFYQGIVDEDFGSKTETAVKAFQKDRQLLSDGIVGNATWESLQELAGMLTAF
jgi:peptidoglycan hydrolase-like protein with peptidoglycan-binding domain